MLLTFAGVFLVVPVEILDHLNKILKLPGLLVGGPNGVKKVDDCCTFIKQKLTRLNKYQLHCLE